MTCRWDVSEPESSLAAEASNTGFGSNQQRVKSHQGQQTTGTARQQHGSNRQQQPTQSVQEPLEVEHDYTAEFLAQWDAVERAEQQRQWWRTPTQQQQQTAGQQQHAQQPQERQGDGAENESRQQEGRHRRRRTSFTAEQEELMIMQAEAASWEKAAEKWKQELQQLQAKHQLLSNQLAEARAAETELRLQLAQKDRLLQQLAQVHKAANAIIGTGTAAAEDDLGIAGNTFHT